MHRIISSIILIAAIAVWMMTSASCGKIQDIAADIRNTLNEINGASETERDDTESAERNDTVMTAQAESLTENDDDPPDHRNFIISDQGFFSDNELDTLNDIAGAIYDQTGIECFLFVTGSDPEIIDYTGRLMDENKTGGDYMAMSITDSRWYYCASGSKASYLSDEEIDEMWGKMTSEDNSTYYDAAIDYFAFINSKMYSAVKITANLSEFGIYNSSAIPEERQCELLCDNAGLLSGSEYEAILSKLEYISSARKMDIAVVTVSTLGGQDIVNYTDDFYDYNGFGQGDDKSGILLLIAVDERRDHVTTTGSAIDIFTYEILDEIMTDVEQNYFANDDWYGGFERFADLCGAAIE